MLTLNAYNKFLCFYKVLFVMTLINQRDYWKNWISSYVMEFDQSGDSVYASSCKKARVNATLTTNPAGCSKRIQEVFGKLSLENYPVSDMSILKEKISEKLNLEANNILIGAGIDGLIAEIARSIVSQENTVVMPKITFPNMAFITRICGGTVIYADMENSILYNLNNLKNLAIRHNAKAIYICNPNNPTGEILPPKDILSTLSIKDTLLIVDEANIEFGGESCICYVKNHPNLIVLRTFSKAYGIAALRIGYACANDELLRLIDRSRPPFPVTSASCAAAILAMEDEKHLDQSVNFILSEKNRIINALISSKFYVYKGVANSVICRKETQDGILKTFFEHGIKVADGRAFGLDSSWCRIAPQDQKSNDIIIDAIKRIGQ